jgi:hypothetical protein
MTIQSKKEYLAILRQRYGACKTRKEKSVIISEVVTNLRLVRKSSIRLLRKKPWVNRKPSTGRKEVYGYDLIKPLTAIWKVAGRPCSKRFKPQIGNLIDRLKVFGEIRFYGNQEQLLRKMSTFTLDRLLEGERELAHKEYGLSGTKRSPLLKTLIPIRTEFDQVIQPGHLEIDCVLHCGESLAGQYAETLNLLDIHTHWNEKQIFFKKTKAKVIGAFHSLRVNFPFPILSVDFDNGKEFVNWEFHGYCKRENLSFTRSRSYHKNDQAHIEGKNYQSVRKVTGYERINDPILISMIDDLYQHEHRLLTNYFYTTLKLKQKHKQEGKSTKIYEIAKTPYQRVMESTRISKKVKDKLTQEYLSLNPAKLQRSLQNKLSKIRDYRSVTLLNLATMAVSRVLG